MSDADLRICELSTAERDRYSRHLLLSEIGEQGQARLKAARVVVVGAGGLGSPALLYLAAAGVGTLGIVEWDRVELSNLQRQVLHGTDSVGTAKIDSAMARLAELNPEVRSIGHRTSLSAKNADEILSDYDVVLDATDNYATRYVINEACLRLQKPNVAASVFRFEGQLSVFSAPGGPCYRCLYPQAPPAGSVPSCGEGGVLGAVTGVLGSLQAAECIKLIAGFGEPLVGRLFCIDLASMQTRLMGFQRNPACPACGEHALPSASFEIEPEALGEDVMLIDVRSEEEHRQQAIAPSRSIPLAELESRSSELPKDQDIVLYCRTGARSASAVELLRAQGFTRVHSLAGGITRWLQLSAE
jgi:molybdopterin/thiamine biosynthesis adenylyltransferase/rhodanese-related sulfurtransferase